MYQKRAKYENTLLHGAVGSGGRTYIKAFRDRMGYLPWVHWAGDGFGAGEYGSGVGGGYGDTGEKSTGKNRKGYSGRSGSHRGRDGSGSRASHFCAKGSGFFNL